MTRNRSALWLVGAVCFLCLLAGQHGRSERGLTAAAMGEESRQLLSVIAVGYPFGKSEVSPQYLQNFNGAGCNWLGIAGEVLDVNLNPVAPGAYRVHVWDSGVDVRVIVGSNPAYGPSGWEVFLFDSPQVQEYNVQLEGVDGTAVSPVYRVATRASCLENLLLFTFVQLH